MSAIFRKLFLFISATSCTIIKQNVTSTLSFVNRSWWFLFLWGHTTCHTLPVYCLRESRGLLHSVDYPVQQIFINSLSFVKEFGIVHWRETCWSLQVYWGGEVLLRQTPLNESKQASRAKNQWLCRGKSIPHLVGRWAQTVCSDIRGEVPHGAWGGWVWGVAALW